jgi:hypothetical protein
MDAVAEKPKTKLGRPRKVLDIELMEKLAYLNCTYEELASVANCSVDTIRREMKRNPTFSEAVLKGKAEGNISLKRQLRQMALNGNIAALIFDLKNSCGYSDKNTTQVNHNVTDDSEGLIDKWKTMLGAHVEEEPKQLEEVADGSA